MQVSDVSDTSSLPYGLGAVTASMTGHKWMFWDAKYTDFLRFRIAVLVPIHLRRPAIHHIPHRTHKTGTYSQTVLPLAPVVGSRLFCCPVPQDRPLGGRYTQKELTAQPVVTGWMFEGGNAFFQKHIGAVLKGPFSFVPL